MHSGGLEVTKLTYKYTRLEDNNLIRHRRDRTHRLLAVAFRSLMFLHSDSDVTRVFVVPLAIRAYVVCIQVIYSLPVCIMRVCT